MTKKRKRLFKKHRPWDYDAFYGDPVTGQTGTDAIGVEVFFIVLIALGIWGLKCLIC